MTTFRNISAIVLACALVNACAVRSTKQQLTVKPVSSIKHSENVNADAHYQRGTYYQTRGNLALALEAYNDALTLDSRHAEARNAMATIYSQQGNFPKAEAMLREAVEQNPNAAHLRNNLGYVYFLQGNHSAAAAEFRAALKLEPNNEWARNNLEMAQAGLAKQPDKVAERAKPSPTTTAIPLDMQNNIVPLDVWSDVDQSKSAKQAAPATATLAVTGTTTTPPKAPELISSNSFRLELSNGSGIAGLATRLRKVLTRLGIPVKLVTNERPYKQVVTEIQYRNGYEYDAKNLRDKLRGQAMISQVTTKRPVDIRVVLGKDLKAQIAEIESQNSTRVATSNDFTNVFLK